jgi:hypothetical protein
MAQFEIGANISIKERGPWSPIYRILSTASRLSEVKE